ncbi:hypothetical protein BC936DRAFT_149300 [Jimgerdemannia flammicorona]|uniref:Box C/D snoRNA protein 1 n=1 Tax=Jimgerdemannia flammicorona TaxID=994334 RepID=A0A433D143_9FUNG|nr:hypothetical protein BC936DRAFT_149300 [Jimgerdemannia flammicorona]
MNLGFEKYSSKPLRFFFPDHQATTPHVMGTEITTPLPPSHIESAALPNRAPPPCEQCHVRFSKYRCPRCSVRTCSLACSKSHKAATGCSGERSKNHFVPISKYGHQDMMSDSFTSFHPISYMPTDYVFLEDLSRTTDTLTRENLRADPHRNMTKRAQFKGRQLVKQAERMGIQLTVMSPAMKRHQISQTNWSFR